jgi:hypothetical protein
MEVVTEMTFVKIYEGGKGAIPSLLNKKLIAKV